jgi:BlaI family transcriptional regulator, penicillinase repressor
MGTKERRAMPRKRMPGPTQGELEILQVLWAKGPLTVRQIYAALQPEKKTSFTTTLKFVQIMMEKGTVVRDESVRPHLYRPVAAEREMQGHLVEDFVHRVFGGSARKLVAAVAQRVSKKELAEIERVVNQLKENRQ